MGELEYETDAGKKMEYVANQFHFHQGSEHTFEGGRFDMEMHIVHTNTAESYPSQEKHLVLGFWYEKMSDAEGAQQARGTQFLNYVKYAEGANQFALDHANHEQSMSVSVAESSEVSEK